MIWSMVTYALLLVGLISPQSDAALIQEATFIKSLPAEMTWATLKKRMPKGTRYEKAQFFAGEDGPGNRIEFKGKFNGFGRVLSAKQARFWQRHVEENGCKHGELDLHDSDSLVTLYIRAGGGKLRQSKDKQEYMRRVEILSKRWGPARVGKWADPILLDGLSSEWKASRLQYLDWSALFEGSASYLIRDFKHKFRIRQRIGEFGSDFLRPNGMDTLKTQI